MAVEVVYTNHTRSHAPGDRASVDAETARRLVRDGFAEYPNKATAAAAAKATQPAKKVKKAAPAKAAVAAKATKP